MNHTGPIFHYMRGWHDFAFSNKDVKPNHAAIYFYALQLNNMLGWKEHFGFPASQVMEITGIASYNTYIKAFRELVGWGVIKLIRKSENQFTANIIALSKFDESDDKSLDNSVLNHMSEQDRSNIQSTDSIDKPKDQKPKNQKKERERIDALDFLQENFKERFKSDFLDVYVKKLINLYPNDFIQQKERFKIKLNAKVERENIPYKENTLFGTLISFTESWIERENKGFQNLNKNSAYHIPVTPNGPPPKAPKISELD